MPNMKNLVFVVEDNPIQQKMLKVHFEEMLGNYDVRTFPNPDEMLEHLKEKPFAVVLDHFFNDLQERTGLHYLREIRKRNKTLPVIYYTSLEDEKTKAEVMQLGAEEYIIKNSASLVRLRTALDLIHGKRKSFFSKIFG